MSISDKTKRHAHMEFLIQKDKTQNEEWESKTPKREQGYNKINQTLSTLSVMAQSIKRKRLVFHYHIR